MSDYRGIGALLVAMLMVSLVGCKAGPAKGTDFAGTTPMAKDPTLPFHRVWFSPNYDQARYKKIYVAPVNTSYMLKMTDWQKGERKDDIIKDVEKLSKRTEESFKKAFRDDPKHKLQVINTPSGDSETVIFEFALIEVIPSKVTLNALGYAPFFVGTTVTVVRSLADDKSFVAMEARLRDAGTGQVVALFADREAEQAALVTVRGLTWYSHAETITDQWAQQFVQIMNRKKGETVKDTDAFTLQPW